MSQRPVTKTWPGWLIALHWIIALALVIMIGAGRIMAKAQESAATTGDYSMTVLGMPLFQAYQIHKSVGLTLFALILLRLGLRLALGVSTPSHAHSRAEQLAALSMQIALYVLMLLIPISGWLLASSSPLGVPTVWFGLLPVPHPLSPDATREVMLSNLHAMGGSALLILAGLHATAALKHHLLDRDGTLAAMLPIMPKRKKS